MKDIDDAIRQFGVRIGLPSLKLDTDGICALTVAGDLEIFFEKTANDRQLRLNGNVGTPTAEDVSIYRALLIANYGGHGTGEAALTMDPVSGEVVLTQLIDVAAADIGTFATTVETFVKYVKFWSGYLPSIGPAAGNASAAAPVSEMGMIRI